jgi:hypothetical protein
MCFFFNPGPVRRVPIPNRYTAKAKLCFCKNNKRRIIRVVLMQLPGLGWSVEGALVSCGMQSEANNFVKHGHRLFPRILILVKVQAPATSD